MRVFDRIPVGAVKNADILGKSQSKLRAGERVLDIAVDIENLPMSGKICFAETNVVRMAKRLDYGVRTPDEEAELQQELTRLRAADDELTKLREALSNV